ncbi:MAG: hypothetical protein BGO41_06845 [Clostridiales bacterium 38-18]|nr:MAG: hypothetical protein BGO41_06845 [Clostridiales bacterium 38-18]
MNTTIKSYSYIGLLLFFVAVSIALGLPMYLGMATTCALGYLFLSRKGVLPKLILHNTKSVSKTMLLMFLISITLPVLMASGALPTAIYYATQWMVGQNLLLAGFVISFILSMILGSAIGTLTITLPLFSSIAIQAGVFYPIMIGALLSGVYIGDRCSPLSSGLHLLSSITKTDYKKNMWVLLTSAILPFIVTIVFFVFKGQSTVITKDLITANEGLKLIFSISLLRLMPLVLLIVLLLFNQPITRVLTIVFSISLLLSIQTLGSFSEIIDTLYHGFSSTESSVAYLKTSGFKQMLNVILVIFFSGIFNSLLEADNLMEPIIDPFVPKKPSKSRLMFNTGVLSIVLSMVTCSQAMTSMVTGKYMAPHFDAQDVKREFLVMLTANLGLNIVALIPWNVNGIMIKQLTGVSTLDYLPYAFFILVLSIFSLVLYPSILSFNKST